MRYFTVNGFRQIVYKVADIHVAHNIMSDVIRTMTVTRENNILCVDILLVKANIKYGYKYSDVLETVIEYIDMILA